VSAPRYEWQPTSEEIAARAGIPTGDVERMDQNTSPSPTSWALDVVAAPSERLNDYPAASYVSICEAAARVAGVDSNRIVPGAGVDELILLAGRAFLGSSTTAVIPTPAYPLYEIASIQAGADIVEVAADPPAFDFPTDAVTAAAALSDVVWLCVPSNPIGNRPPDDAIETVVAAAKGIVIIDAAYAEFAGDSWVELASLHDNVLVMHTLSKAYGLAGARVGYAIGHERLVDAIDAVRPPGSIASLSVELAVAALSMPERMTEIVRLVDTERGMLAKRLEDLGLGVLPSVTNFLLCEVGPSAHRVEGALMDRGIVVRRFAGDGPLAGHLRFTVRTPQAHDRLIEALAEILPNAGGDT
jgi:histidinol-phosphate aminotransferase